MTPTSTEVKNIKSRLNDPDKKTKSNDKFTILL